MMRVMSAATLWSRAVARLSLSLVIQVVIAERMMKAVGKAKHVMNAARDFYRRERRVSNELETGGRRA